MVNKKGWLRIAEAFIAIMLILGVMVVLYSNSVNKPKKAIELYNTEKILLDEISFNNTLRDAVLVNRTDVILNYVQSRLAGSGFNSSARVCSVDDICNLPFYQKQIFSTDRIISSNLTLYSPMKVKIFMWLES